MANALERLSQAGSNAVGDHTFVDADTLRSSDGELLRLQGYDAPEIAGFKGGQWKTGTAGGGATSAVTALAQKFGFKNVAPALDANGEPMTDPNGRPIVRLTNDNGEDFTTKVLESGIFKSGKYTMQDDLDAMEVARVFKDENAEPTEWGQAADQVASAIEKEAGKDLHFKKAALDEAQLAQFPGYVSSAVQFRSPDRTIDNRSLNPFSDNWEQGWIGVKEGAYGTLNMLGESTGWDAAADIGEAGVERARKEIRDYGTSLTDWRDINGFGDAVQYVTNNAALSLPYMAISVGAAVTAAPTMGLSLTAPASIYAGQTWNEMEGENKNAAIAIGSGVAQAALDRLGLNFIFKKGVGSTQLLKDATEELVKRGATREAAEAQVMAATRKELAGFVGDTVKVANEQIAAKQIFKNLAKAGGVSAAGEGVTEAIQEATGYTAAHWTGEGFNFNDLNKRMLDGFIAGATLGGAFSVPGTMYDAGAWADVAVRQAPAQTERLSKAGQYAEAERQQFGRVASNEENAAQARAAGLTAGANSFPTLNERSEAHNKSKRERTFGEAFFETVAATPSLWRGATRNIFTEDVLSKSRAARKMADMFGGGLQKTFSGATYENAKHHIVSIYKNMVDQPNDFYAKLNNGKTMNRKQKERTSQEIYRKLRGAIDQDGNFNPDLLPDNDPQKPMLIHLQSQLARMSDKMFTDQKNYNQDLGYLQNYLLRYKSFNKKSILDNKPEFVQKLMAEFNMDEKDANAIADSITSSPDINDIGDALTAAGAAGNPGSHKQRTLHLSENPEFDKFMEQDIFSNINNAARSAARFVAYEQYVGKDHVVLNQLLREMEQDGLTPAEVNKIAKQMKDYLDAESGNYKRPQSEAGKRLQQVQRSFMMVTTIAGLPLATISSFVEMALSMKGLTMDQIFGKGDKPGGLHALGNELGQTLWSGVKEVGSLATNKHNVPAATRGKEMLQNLGYYDWDIGAATTTGVTEINPWQQQIYEAFFKWNGLQGWTNYTRAIRASIAGDYIIDKMETILEATENTNEVQEAREALRNLGVNVDDMLDAYRGNGMFDPGSADIIEQNFREGTFNFVNEAVALPQSGNRPLIYQDPRFALFTQFQGFMATFTANHIPKLWGEYVKRGTPAMKYNAFAVMATMVMMGFASQYLKDLIKYGKPMAFGPEDHPFLNRAEYLQRGVRASGLLGTGERVLDQFFPLYDQRSENAGEWLYHGVTGESPALGYANKALRGIGAGLTGDVGGAAREAVRFTPAGPFNFVRDAVEGAADNWNFKGE